MKCRKCGIEIPDDSIFCNVCGAKQKLQTEAKASKKEYQNAVQKRTGKKKRITLLVVLVLLLLVCLIILYYSFAKTSPKKSTADLLNAVSPGESTVSTAEPSAKNATVADWGEMYCMFADCLEEYTSIVEPCIANYDTAKWNGFIGEWNRGRNELENKFVQLQNESNFKAMGKNMGLVESSLKGVWGQMETFWWMATELIENRSADRVEVKSSHDLFVKFAQDSLKDAYDILIENGWNAQETESNDDADTLVYTITNATEAAAAAQMLLNQTESSINADGTFNLANYLVLEQAFDALYPYKNDEICKELLLNEKLFLNCLCGGNVAYGEFADEAGKQTAHYIPRANGQVLEIDLVIFLSDTMQYKGTATKYIDNELYGYVENNGQRQDACFGWHTFIQAQSVLIVTSDPRATAILFRDRAVRADNAPVEIKIKSKKNSQTSTPAPDNSVANPIQSAYDDTGSFDYELNFDGERVVCATTREYHKTFINYSMNENIDAINRMLDDGKLFFAPAHTDIELLDYGLSVCKVRIGEGTYKGQVGYVVTEAVHSK